MCPPIRGRKKEIKGKKKEKEDVPDFLEFV